MNKKDHHHIIDILFVIALFCIFVMSALFLISIGANIYSKTVNSMGENFDSRTAVAYITEKIHQSDENGNISISYFDGCPAIVITSVHNDKEYTTYIYEYENELMELMMRSDVVLSPEVGQSIIAIEDFNIKKIDDQLVRCSIVMNEGTNYDFYICLHTEKEES